MKTHCSIWITALCTGLLLTACTITPSISDDRGVSDTRYTSTQIAEVIVRGQVDAPALHTIFPDSEQYSIYLENYYKIDESLLIDGVIYNAGGTEATEIAVFSLADEAKSTEVETALLDYIENRIGDFTGYMPKQAALLEDSIVATSGPYVALLICGDSKQAQSSFLACFSQQSPIREGTADDGRPGNTAAPPSETDSAKEDADPYDREAILLAWKTGDRSPLSPKNQEILDACTAAISEVITEDMSDYEKELAIHDWLVKWTSYDPGAVSHVPGELPDPDNDNPYGPLLHQKATCLGYSYTFQLLMELLGFECITVEGTAREGTAEHAWNMVRIDGEWYCVDVTWNDPEGDDLPADYVGHDFFNVTSRFLRKNDHQWVDKNIPVATAKTYSWKNKSA